MNHRLGLPASLACLVLSLTVPAGAAEPALPGATPRVLLEASEGGGSLAVDSSTFHNDGVLRNRIERVNGTYRFYPVGPEGQHHRIRVAPDPSLNPGSHPFAYGGDFRVSPTAVWENSEMAVIRHGDSDTSGGDYKMEFARTDRVTVTATCVMHDARGGYGFVRGDGRLLTIDDGQWHHIICSRDPVAGTVSLTIDGHTVSRADRELGSIVGGDPLLIGVQPREYRTGLREQFDGRMDNISVAVAS